MVEAPRAGMRLLALGLDAAFTEKLKASIKAHHLRVRTTFAADAGPLPTRGDAAVDAVLVQAPGQFGQALRLVQELLYRFPRAAVIVVSPKSDSHLLIHFFRAGAFDVLLPPVDALEIAQALRRAGHRPLDLKNPAEWTPLQAGAHFFTRSPGDWDDLADNLHRYFGLFLELHDQQRFRSADAFLAAAAAGGEIPRRLRQFVADPRGVFFGLGSHGPALRWAVKLAPNYFVIWEGHLQRRAPREEIFGASFINMLRGQRAHQEAHQERERMRHLALTDEITGLWNQRRLQADLEERVGANQAFGLLFIDIDFFKTVNDRYGHVYGSQLLIDMASILRRELRGSDLIYRYGGDEFIVLLPQTSIDVAKKIAVRLSEAVKNHEFTVQEQPYRLSLSVGLADFPLDAATAKDLIDFADKMMYLSKKSGRGKVFHVTEVL
jgi:diguanylate cyclase (GGDEF)-like protein